MFCTFILSIFIIVWLYLSCKNAICTKFWTGAVVRYYGNWKWRCSCIVCHKPIKFGHEIGNKLYLTIILTFIPNEGKSKSYKHSLIIYWTALVYVGIEYPRIHAVQTLHVSKFNLHKFIYKVNLTQNKKAVGAKLRMAPILIIYYNVCTLNY